MTTAENSGDASMLLRCCFQALREEVADAQRARAAAEAEQAARSFDAAREQLLARVAAKVALALLGTQVPAQRDSRRVAGQYCRTHWMQLQI